MAVVSSTGGATIVNGPVIPNQAGPVGPVLQLQDGSFVGLAAIDPDNWEMVAFDQSGNVRWTVPNYIPVIATVDGGVIAIQSPTDFMGFYAGPFSQAGPAFTFDQNGNATGQLPNLLIPSWTTNTYQIGTAEQIKLSVLIASTRSALEVAFQALGIAWQAAHFQIDSIANDKVKQIMSPATWQKFAHSHCAAVLGNTQGGIPSPGYYGPGLIGAAYSLQGAQNTQAMTNFYAVDNPGIGQLTLGDVTGTLFKYPMSNEKLTDYLTAGGADAAVPTLADGGPQVVLIGPKVWQIILNKKFAEFPLMHEILLHAYAGISDEGYFNSSYFTGRGLWRAQPTTPPTPNTGTHNLTRWLSTDCTCTPGGPWPGHTGQTCPASMENTAKW